MFHFFFIVGFRHSHPWNLIGISHWAKRRIQGSSSVTFPLFLQCAVLFLIWMVLLTFLCSLIFLQCVVLFTWIIFSIFLLYYLKPIASFFILHIYLHMVLDKRKSSNVVMPLTFLLIMILDFDSTKTCKHTKIDSKHI